MASQFSEPGPEQGGKTPQTEVKVRELSDWGERGVGGRASSRLRRGPRYCVDELGRLLGD